jgi:hypothetical protein
MRLASSRGISALAVALATSACADFSTFKQPADLEKTSYSMDAKQRVIVSLEHIPIAWNRYL